MTRSVSRERIRAALPLATHDGRDEALEAGHGLGRDPVGPLGGVPREAERILELVCGGGSFCAARSTRAPSATNRRRG